MGNYVVSARKYRPSTFSGVVGQKALTATLRNSIAKDRLAHAYLFCGSRGVGKTSCARIFAKTINCEHRTPDGEACNECQSCQEFNRNSSLNIIELDAASNNGVDAIRELTEQVQVPPINARYRVFIIDEVHMLSTSAFNAFLKTLEEPPAYVVFILATTEKHKILPTILSRCQIYDFNRITIQDMVEHLQYVASQEQITTEVQALEVIARKADGAMRDALSIFDQVAAAGMGNVSYARTIDNLNILDYAYFDRLTEAFLNGDVATSLLIYKEIRDKGFGSQFFINGLAQHFRNLMVARDESTLCLLEAGDDARREMQAVAQRCSAPWLYKAMDLCNTADLKYRDASNKQLLVELTLIKLCQAVSPSPNSDAGEGQLNPIAVTPTPASGSASPQQPQSSPTPSKPTTSGAATTVTPPPPPPTTRPSTSTRPRITSLPGGGLSIKGGGPKKAEPTASAAPTQSRTSEFTDDDFARAWKAIMAAHPKEHIMVNAMRMSMPTRADGHTFSIKVESEAIRDGITQSLTTILPELRNRLANDHVELNITLDKGQASSMSLTEGELYAKMRADHPALNTLIEDWHLTIS